MGLLRRNKKNNPRGADACEEKMSNKASHINKNWIIGILAALVIILVAVILSSKLFNNKNVAMVISFTATILSIVLSLLAILYSYLGNISSSDNLSEIRIAVAEIKATENDIKHFMSNLPLGNANGGPNGVSNKIEDENKAQDPPSNNNSTGSIIDDTEEAAVVGNAGNAKETVSESN